MAKLSADSQKLLNSLPANQRPAVKRRLQKLERELHKHRTACISLIVANEKGGANGGDTDWDDINLAIEFAEKALGKKEVRAIRKDVHEQLGAELDEDEE